MLIVKKLVKNSYVNFVKKIIKNKILYFRKKKIKQKKYLNIIMKYMLLRKIIF